MLKHILSLFISALFSFNASAAEVAGVQFAENIAGSNLKLNGAGMRYKLWFDVYAAALYVESPSTDGAKVINQNGAKRLIMHIIYDDISKQKMVDAMLEGFEDNLSREEHAKLKPRIDSLLSHYQGVQENDVLVFDYTPNKGTTFSINESNKVTIQGIDFNQALLKIWVGDEPATDSLKDALLGIKDNSD